MQAKRWVAVAALVVGLSWAGEASAQRSRFGFFGRSSSGSLVSLAAEESVQKDIGLSGDICARLRDLQDNLRSTSQKEYGALGFNFQTFQNLSEAERQKLQTAMAEVSAKLTTEYEGRVRKLLSDDEFKRLKQIQLQVQGADALTTTEVAAALALSEEQRAKLTDLKSEYASKQQDLYRSESDSTERGVKLRELAQERDAKANEILTDNQRQAWTELLGQTFDVSVIRSGGRRN